MSYDIPPELTEWMTQNGFAAPTTAAADGSFYSQDKLQQLLTGVQPGADGRKVLDNDAWMELLNPISGLHEVQAADPGHLVSGGDSQDPSMSAATAAIYADSLGRTYRDIGGGQVQYFDNSGGGWQNPTGNSGDRIQPTYQLGADGLGTPVSSGANYKPSEWVSSGRDAAIIGGTVLSAGALGATTAGTGGLFDLGSGAAVGGGGGGGLEAEAGGGGGGSLFGTEAPTAGFESLPVEGAGSAPAYGGVGTEGAGAAGEGGLADLGTAPAYGGPGTAGAGAAGEGGSSGIGDIMGKIGTALGSGSVGQYGQLLTSLYGMYQGNKMSGAASQTDPFAPYRAGYAQQLQSLMKNPASIQNDPGYKASQDAAEQTLTRNLASQGLTGSGTAASALATEGAQFQSTYYNQQIQTLAGLGGANINNAGINLAGQAAGANTINNSLNNLFKLFSSFGG